MPLSPRPLVAASAPASYPLRLTHRHSRRRLPVPRAVSVAASHADDAIFLRRVADVADRSAGLTCPHPNFGCVIARPPQRETDDVEARVVGEGFLYAQAASAPASYLLCLTHIHSRRRLPVPRAVSVAASHADDAIFLRRAADVADRSAGLTCPHPNFGCVIARPPQRKTDDVEARVVGEGFLYAQGTPCAEQLAAEEAGEHARGATAYLNLEPDNCYGDSTVVSSLV